MNQEWQRLWFRLQTRPCTSLAVLGTEHGSDAGRVTMTLAAIGNRDGQVPVRVISAIGASFADVPRILGQLSQAAAEHSRTLVPCDSLQSNPATIPILHASAGVILIVRLGDSMLESMKTTVELVGRDRVMATITVG